LLIVFIITTIWRARLIRGVAMENALGSEMISCAWQLTQSKSSAEANIPIVSRNWSAGMPLSTWTFSKTCSAIRTPESACAAWGGAAWVATDVSHTRPRRDMATAPKTLGPERTLIMRFVICDWRLAICG
jgi:hypothetical protein